MNEMSDANAVDGGLLEVENLSVTYEARRGTFIKRTEFIRAVKSVSFKIRKGTTMGLVGESGSGKSTIGKAILRLAPIGKGSIKYDRKELTQIGEREFMPYRKYIPVSNTHLPLPTNREV